MKLYLLTPRVPKNPDSALKISLDLMTESAKARGYELVLISTEECKMRFTNTAEILVNNKKLHIPVLIVKASFSWTNADVHASIIKQFELTGVETMNSFGAIATAKNKIRSLQIMSTKKIPIPKTYVVRSAEYVPEIVHDIGKYPVILKSVSGAKGIGVSIVESERGLRSIIQMMIDDDNSSPLIIQEYIKEASGKDFRVVVVGGKIVAAMNRIATRKGEFRSNFALGGRVKIAELTAEEKKIAIRATKAFGLDFAGVDIIRSKNGPKVLEVNSNPGLDGITKATGIDVAGAIIDFAIKRTKEKKKR
ncbi:MAG: Ribosomal protein S6 modification protein [Candidatus Magasanikbacteria bacterium GW2011_GWD2_43_18]|uniref:Ribosomal protein S6 modification protein n=1 Tax=Candidatus Magasanikbacteria bacterium GW2011_GWE2_42_7 TaxID=1619052 RepID=A0A0G1BH09_9BACT|nr:MAG: Ribosomal protein S6 modification protein [Candidatus Magasanikbacteria bacterium GW2011_GWC2_42_27]KKS72690.1 MAG: Ribosomal protein S6 modification protein [Candidatus Magasanikbacteria bacterium GW2011_GWE2_42_7]KKT04979.1 MAG: Ribosomal protein S6 modification protein [Candidatus Magasanikbacteria bacterium GW2011_GWD2_43_18]HBB38290.1 30S ribosomal protein S6--L-glutamate ligase [Candidatus Magasanikbacteria bacterium]HCC13604.1 30S ribosomal protein S6--L-glutamate ligase [Candida